MSETVVREIPKNSREHIRVGLGTFKGHELFSIRVWIAKDDGTALPTQKGITCAVALLPAVIDALQATLEHARKTGVLPDG
jgi:membrane carboxypeptidase/penicillin-binding protein PbpC